MDKDLELQALDEYTDAKNRILWDILTGGRTDGKL